MASGLWYEFHKVPRASLLSVVHVYLIEEIVDALFDDLEMICLSVVQHAEHVGAVALLTAPDQKRAVVHACDKMTCVTISALFSLETVPPLTLMRSMACSLLIGPCNHISLLDSGLGATCSSRLRAKSWNPFARAKSEGVSFFGVRDLQGAERMNFVIIQI